MSPSASATLDVMTAPSEFKAHVHLPWCWVLLLAGLCCVPAPACTIFVLTDTNHALFCNNEDWLDLKTRIWFEPAGNGYFGTTYVGFDSAMGGMNTEGLAYDWVGGFPQRWQPKPGMQTDRGNATRRMLETCATVKDAIAFYRTHYDPTFRQSTILVADRTGASATISAGDGELQVELDGHCRGFGYGEEILEATLTPNSEATVANGFKILRDCRQTGAHATRYSNIYDLKRGDIFLYPFPDRDDEVKLNLTVELQKGAHYYDMPAIKEEMAQAPRPLLLAMKRFPFDEFKPIPDRDPEVTAHVRTIVRNMTEGASRAEDYRSESWKALSDKQKEIQDDMKRLGEFVSLTLLEHREEKGWREYRYRLDFANVALLQRFVFDGRNKLAGTTAEGMEWQAGAAYADMPLPAVKGTGVGIGVVLVKKGTNIIVSAIVPNSPAASQKDLHVGDRILAIAQAAGPSVPVESGKLTAVAALIRGASGTTVHLTIVSPEEPVTSARVVSFVRTDLKTLPQ